MHHPWEHAIAAGVGGVAGKWLADWEAKTSIEVDQILQRRAENNKRIAELNSES